MLFRSNILFTNDIVCGLVIDAVSELKRSPLNKQMAKRLGDKVWLERAKYEAVINRKFNKVKREEFFADANDIVGDELKSHIDKLYYCIKQTYDKHFVGYSGIISRIQLTTIMCEYSCLQYEKRMKEIAEFDKGVKTDVLSYLRLTAMLSLLKQLVASIPNTALPLNTSECELAIEIISKKLSDGRLISRAIAV